MSEDEIAATIISTIVALIGWATWFSSLAVVRNWSAAGLGRRRLALMLTPLLCAVGLVLVLGTVASYDVVNDPSYIAMYLVMGLAWAAVTRLMTPLFGISYRFDVLERGNPAASIAVIGYLLGVTAAFAGGNIGDGPGWWVVVACAAMSTVGLLACWFVVELLGRCSESITVERDLASGVRLAGFLLAVGLVLGRAVAGDWVSMEATVRDFIVTAWPASAMVVGAVVLEWLYRPSGARRDCPLLMCGVIPAAAYIGSALLYIITLGIPQ